MHALDDTVSLRIFYGGNAWFDTVICEKVSEILFEFRPVVENYDTRSRVPRMPIVLQLAHHGCAVLVVHGVEFKPARSWVDEGDCLQLSCGALFAIDGDCPWADEVHAQCVPWDGFCELLWGLPIFFRALTYGAYLDERVAVRRQTGPSHGSGNGFL